MNREDIDDIHSCGPDCQRPICVLVRKAVADERNKLAAWMIQFGFATGHGDTMEQLLDALGTEIVDLIAIEVEAERETRNAEMLHYLPILERAEANPELWSRLTHGLGIATLNGYRAVIAKAQPQPQPQLGETT